MRDKKIILSSICIGFLVVATVIFILLNVLITWKNGLYQVPPESCNSLFQLTENVPKYESSTKWRVSKLIPNSITYETTCSSDIWFYSKDSDKVVIIHYMNYFKNLGFSLKGSTLDKSFSSWQTERGVSLENNEITISVYSSWKEADEKRGMKYTISLQNKRP